MKLFEKITYLDEYYLTNAEIEVLKTHADKIAERIPDGGRLVELGSGYVFCPGIAWVAYSGLDPLPVSWRYGRLNLEQEPTEG